MRTTAVLPSPVLLHKVTIMAGKTLKNTIALGRCVETRTTTATATAIIVTLASSLMYFVFVVQPVSASATTFKLDVDQHTVSGRRTAADTTPTTVHGPGSKPHIIIALGDDTGWWNLGWHNQEMKTPAMDSLVKNGIELDRHYTFVFCSPTRSALMSGRLPVHVNQKNSAEWGWNMPAVHENMTMIAAKLKGAGYRTHQVSL